MTALADARRVLTAKMLEIKDQTQQCFALVEHFTGKPAGTALFLEAERGSDVDSLPIYGTITLRTYSHTQITLGAPGKRRYETAGAILTQVFAKMENVAFQQIFNQSMRDRDGQFVFTGADQSSAEADRDGKTWRRSGGCRS